jgi:hypothetical protein
VKDRAVWVDQALSEVRSQQHSPLILRLSAQSEESLADGLTQLAEQQLALSRAPGGLYDESSCRALPALGGWLFRARSVGHSGLLVVLEEIDTWLDRRGWPVESHEAFTVLGALLEERLVRPVSVLCSVRSGDASGNAAIPAAVVALFDARVSLNPAATVVRDPSTIVSVLSGRSFTRGALADAVSQWADVPDDETMIVFSSPLAPTLVPSMATDGTVNDTRGPLDHGVAAALDETSLSWKSTVLTDGSRTQAQAVNATTPTRSHHWGRTLRAAIEVRTALESLGAAKSRRSVLQLERVFVRSVSKLPLALEMLQSGVDQLDADAGPLTLDEPASDVGDRPAQRTRQGATLLRRGVAALTAFEEAFSSAYHSAHGAWIAGAARPTMLHDVVAALHTTAAERAARTTAVLILSGLRADLWAAVQAALVQQTPGLSVIRQAMHWAASPVTSAMQKSLLSRGNSALGVAPAEAHEPPVPRSLDEAAQLRREHVGHTEIHRNTLYSQVFLDSAMHSLTDVVAQTQARTVRAVQNFVAGFPRDSLLLVAADVGSRLSSKFGLIATDTDVSAFEVLLPHTLFLWSLDSGECTNESP